MKKITTLVVISILSLASFAHAGDEADKQASYPLTTCVVSGEALDEMGTPFVFDFEGQEVQLCCKDCKEKFEKDSATYIKQIEAAKAVKGVPQKPEADQQ